MLKLLLRALFLSVALVPQLNARSVLIYGRGQDAKKLDPADITDGESVKVVSNIFDNLVTYAEDSAEIVPELAVKWDVSEDGKTWAFHLRPDVKFHDGTPLNSEAVVFTINRIIDPENEYRFQGAFGYAGSYKMIESVRAVDALTVEFKLKFATVIFLPNLAMFPAGIISPAAMKKLGENFGMRPVGTGPFKFQAWSRQEKLVLVANQNYWAGKPEVDSVIFKPVRENSARSLQLEQGAIHMMDGIDFSDVARLQETKGVQVHVAPGMNFAYLAMNNAVKPFDNPMVRKAIAHAVDKPKIIKLAYHGFGQPGVNPLPPTIWGYHEGIQDYPLDTAKAKALLQEAGFPNGFKTQLWAMPNPRPYMPQPRKVAQVIQEGLKAIGVEIEIVTYDWGQYLERTANGEHPMCLLGWSTDNADPDNFLYELLDKTNAVKGSALNVSFYRSDPLHELLTAAQREYDRSKRLSLYHKAQEIIHQDVPMVPLAYLPIVQAQSTRVKGYTVHPTGLIRLRKVSLSER